MNFNDFSLDERIMRGVQAAGYETPTPIQQQAIPIVTAGSDVLGLAQTGTGKTAAFLLPILQRLTTGPLRKTRALIIAPTRELAEQIHESAQQLGKFTKIRSMTAYGGVGKGPQIAGLKRGTEIVVACPGRLLDLIGDRHVNLKNLDVLVLDEADQMCDMGFLPDIRRILRHVPAERQTLFFSATMPDDIRNLSSDMLTNPQTVQIGMIAPAETVTQAWYPVPQKKKKDLLFTFLDATATGQVLVFTRTKYRARNLARDLERRKFRAIALQGNMSQNQRQKAIVGFKQGKFDILIATDIASRGIDVSGVTHVINFDMPSTVDAYTHRIGRTGRAEQTGEAYTFANEEDADMVRDIEKLLERKLERRRLAEFDYGDFDPDTAFPERQQQQRRKAKSKNSRNANQRNGQKRPHNSGGQNNGQRRRKPKAKADANGTAKPNNRPNRNGGSNNPPRNADGNKPADGTRRSRRKPGRRAIVGKA